MQTFFSKRFFVQKKFEGTKNGPGKKRDVRGGDDSANWGFDWLTTIRQIVAINRKQMFEKVIKNLVKLLFRQTKKAVQKDAKRSNED